MDPRMPWNPFNIEFLLTLSIPPSVNPNLYSYTILAPRIEQTGIDRSAFTIQYLCEPFYSSCVSNSSSSKSNSSINFWLPSPAKHVYLWGQPQIEVNRIPFNCQQFPCCAAPNQPPAHTHVFIEQEQPQWSCGPWPTANTNLCNLLPR